MYKNLMAITNYILQGEIRGVTKDSGRCHRKCCAECALKS